MDCQKCHRTFLDEELVASISGSIMGDEVSDVYYLCPVCDHYTIVTWWDDFSGEETMKVSGPLTQAIGDERIAIIQRCSEPWNKKCRCKAHLEYFNNTLD